MEFFFKGLKPIEILIGWRTTEKKKRKQDIRMKVESLFTVYDPIQEFTCHHHAIHKEKKTYRIPPA
jgi:hypothetical protein